MLVMWTKITIRKERLSALIVGLESVAMFGSFGFFAVWCFTV